MNLCTYVGLQYQSVGNLEDAAISIEYLKIKKLKMLQQRIGRADLKETEWERQWQIIYIDKN